MAHEPGPGRYVARDWPRPGIVNMTRLQRSRVLTSRVNRSQWTRAGGEIMNARSGPISILIHTHVSSSVKKAKLFENFSHKFIEPFFTGGKLPKPYGKQNFWFKKIFYTMSGSMEFVKHNNGCASDELTICQTEIPKLTTGQVLVKVACFGLNRADTLQRQGKYPAPAGESDILGLEMSGEVVEIHPQ